MIPASYLCWYGVPYLPNRVYDYVERVGLGAYLRKYRLSRKAGDLDVSMTWLNLTEWFEKSGLEMHLRQDIWGQVCDLLDDMKYRWEIQPQWYLNESLRDILKQAPQSILVIHIHAFSLTPSLSMVTV
ncbi:hypothetical protein BD309DRAFT_1024072 [Dichomitus squalens]|nr:hypothetical protein BD309DRAFT_1024072 [Dichomitus squalens]